MSATLTDLEGWIQDLMKKKQVFKYTIDVSGNTKKGDGYLGEITFVKIISNEGNRKVYEVVVKSAKKSDAFRQQMPIIAAYEREMFFYTKVIPIFVEFQMENNVDEPFCKFAECYSICRDKNKEALLLENLKYQGFQIHDRKVAQNINHALYVFQNYGKFHAVSLAMRNKQPALFKNLTKNMDDVLGYFLTKTQMIEIFKQDFQAAMDALRIAEGKEKVIDKFKGFENEMLYALTSMTEPDNPQSVILHGDCWNNNMMYKYEGDNTTHPVDMIFIDFQLSRVASPIYDLSYYLYTCCDKKVLKDFDFLLNAYYSSLSDFLRELKCNPDEIITFKQLKNQWKKYGRFGLCMAARLIKMELSEEDEIVDFAESAETGDFNFNFRIKSQVLFEQRVRDVYEHFADRFL